MRLVKSPASPTINQLGFRDVGKSGVAFSRRVSGCLFETRFSRKSGARLSASIKASRPPLRDGAITFGDLIGKRADKPPHGARSTSQGAKTREARKPHPRLLATRRHLT